MTAARMLIFCLLALLVGCSNKPTALNSVSGKVLYKGVPLSTGIIVFSPDTSKGETGKIAFSKIKADGTYTLNTGDAPGATAGWYRVAVSSLSGSTSSYEGGVISLIPEPYRDPVQSKLQCEVKSNRDNHLDFNLD
ncbi:MAG: hypothetical protein HY289_09900 [Planctomycetes bacterium]|nr:hypothetical protein [Planctomycetota bacterium]